MSERLTIAFHGAAGTVTGSKHLLTLGGDDDRKARRVLLDAGMFQGQKDLRLRNWEGPSFDPRDVDQVVLSHTHIDHVGILPRLVKLGLHAPVHCTPAAFDLAKIMLLDAAKLQEEDAARANKKGYSKHKPALPLYTTQDAWDALELRVRESYHRWFELAPNGALKARFHNAGHILGSAFVELEARLGEQTVRIVFSGDIGRYGLPLHPDPEPRPDCDVLIVESTYGDRSHPPTPIEDQLAEPLRRTLTRQGTVLIPAFAVGRSQQITLVLRRLMKSGAIPTVPIHIDSPMAVHATDVYNRFLDAHNVDRDVFEDGRAQLFPDQVEFHETVSASKRLNTLGGPRIVVSASGMLTGGRVLHHLARLAPDERNLLLLVGYQPPGTRGRALQDGARELRAFGDRFPVRCEILHASGLSGHADRDELLRWIGSAATPPAVVFFVHGEPEASAALAEAVASRFGSRTVLPEQGDVFDLGSLLAAKPAARATTAKATAKKAAAPAPLTAPAGPPCPPRRRRRPLPAPTPATAEADPTAAERLEQILASPTYRRADQDPDFLEREELRHLRLGLELLKPDLLLREAGVQATIVVYGGTRIAEPQQARTRLEEARAAQSKRPQDPALGAAVARAERVVAQSRFYAEARELGRIVGRAGGGPADCRLVVVTGGGPGIMEAANRGACDVGAKSVGLNITLPLEQVPNPYITPELCFRFRYFALRKLHFLLRARALVAFPGGYGTLDELFETLCLIQTRKIDPLPVVLVGQEHWRRTFDVQHLVAEGLIDPEDVDLFFFAETAQEIWDGILAWWAKKGESVSAAEDHAAEEEARDAGASERAKIA